MPHSEIPGSKHACCSPRLIAAYHVLHRLLVPRHPSCARIRLTEEKTLVLGIRCNSRTMQLSKNHSASRADPSSRGPSPRKILDPERHTRYRIMLVGVPGIEPGTSSLSGMRSNQLSYTPDTVPLLPGTSSSPHRPLGFCSQPRLNGAGGGNRNRTGDLMLAKHVLYQLSYAPKMRHR